MDETADDVTFELLGWDHPRGSDDDRSRWYSFQRFATHTSPRELSRKNLPTSWASCTSWTGRSFASPRTKPIPSRYSSTQPRGSFVLAPQSPDGRLMLAGTQFRVEEDKTREGWAAFSRDTETLSSMLRQDMDNWPDTIRSALENINKDTFNVWPFYRLPALESWTSPSYRRVVLVGDAAHALPPTTGLGASMALEDVYGLSLLVKKLREEPKLRWADAVKFWQTIRQKRIDDILLLTKQLNNKRLPTDRQAEIIAQFGPQEIWTDRSDTEPMTKWHGCTSTRLHRTLMIGLRECWWRSIDIQRSG